MCRLLTLILGCVLSLNAMAIVFEAQFGFERSTIEPNKGLTSFPDTPIDGGFYQLAAGVMFNITPLVQVPIMAEVSSGEVRYVQISETLKNIGEAKASFGLVTKPAIRLGDGRVYAVVGGAYVPFESRVVGKKTKKNTYFMPSFGFGLSYLIFPDIHIFSESRMYGANSQPIAVAESSTSAELVPSRYGKFTSSVGIFATIF